MKLHTLSLRSVLAAMVAVAGGTFGAQAQLVASPAAISFDRMDQSHQITLTHNGKPLRADQIRGTGVFINENTYEYFFNIQKTEGGLVVKPTPQVEVGVMKLVIYTSHGQVAVEVKTPLEEDPESDISRAKAQGMTVEEYRRSLGLYTNAPREQVSLSLPASYQTGQTMTISMDKKSGRLYTWKVNGEVVAQGEEANVLNHTFRDTGAKTIEYVETANGKTVATATATTNVVPAPAPTTVVVVR